MYVWRLSVCPLPGTLPPSSKYNRAVYARPSSANVVRVAAINLSTKYCNILLLPTALVYLSQVDPFGMLLRRPLLLAAKRVTMPCFFRVPGKAAGALVTATGDGGEKDGVVGRFYVFGGLDAPPLPPAATLRRYDSRTKYRAL